MTSGPEHRETPLVSLEDVELRADAGEPLERAILSGIQLQILPGARVGMVGRSGAGKTTLATVLAGLAEPTSGRVVRSRPREAPSGFSADVGLVFQEPERGFFEESVWEDVSFGPRNTGLTREAARDRAREALSMVGLDPDEVGPRAPETLSGGEARRVAIAGVLALGPRLLIFDEPTCGLDADGFARFRAILESLRARDVAYFVISHELGIVIEECERVLVLEEGRIQWDGPPSRLRDGLPPEWLEAPTTWGAELTLIADAMLARGWLAENAPPTPSVLAEAWAKR